MSGKTLTLLAILAFVALTFGAFVWVVLSWDKAKTPSASAAPRTIEERSA